MVRFHFWEILLSESKQKILVVEDDADTRALYRKALHMEGYNVAQAADGVQAFEYLDNGDCPDLILLDLSIPQLGGVDFMKRLREHVNCAKTKVVLVSGWENLATRARELGAEAFMRKPVELTQLYATIKNLI